MPPAATRAGGIDSVLGSGTGPAQPWQPSSGCNIKWKAGNAPDCAELHLVTWQVQGGHATDSVQGGVVLVSEPDGLVPHRMTLYERYRSEQSRAAEMTGLNRQTWYRFGTGSRGGR